jgi:hypothetical protein
MSEVGGAKPGLMNIGEEAKPPFAVLPDPSSAVLPSHEPIGQRAGSRAWPAADLAGLEPPAYDVATLGLDMLMAEEGRKRGGQNPFLLGY